jgi:predicted DNA-binding transcriptional regulator AlpA
MSTDQINPVEPVLIDRKGLARLGLVFSNTWLLELERTGGFPARLSIGARKTVWLLSEVREFIGKRASEREASSAARSHAIRTGAGRDAAIAAKAAP